MSNIAAIVAREILDSRGNPTVEVDVRRRVVDATYLSPTIPATTPPPPRSRSSPIPGTRRLLIQV